MNNTSWRLFLSIFSSLDLFITFEISLHFLKPWGSYLYNKTLCTSLSFNDIYLQTTINLVTARKKKKLVVRKMKIVLGNVLHKIEFPKSIKARAFSNTLNPNCSYTVFCFDKYRKYLSQNSCGGHVFNKFERGLPLVLSNVYPISWMHLFLFFNTAEQYLFWMLIFYDCVLI